MADTVRVVEFDTEGGVHVTVEGDSHDDVTGQAARRLALKEAEARGYIRCGISTSYGPYVVDEGGCAPDISDVAERLRAESALLTTGRGRYRNRFKVQPPLA